MKSEQLRALLNDHHFIEEIAPHRPRKNRLSLLLTLLAFSTPLAAGTYAVTTPQDSGAGSLRNSIQSANQDSKPSLILLPSGAKLVLNGPLQVNSASPMTIRGSVESPTILDGQGLSRVLFINPALSKSPPLNVENLIIQNFAATGFAGGFAGGTGGAGGGSPGVGGSLYLAPGQQMSFTSVTFQNNTATGGSGGSTNQTTNALTAGGGGAGAGGAGGNANGFTTGAGGGGGGSLTSTGFAGGNGASAGGGGGGSDQASGASSSGNDGGAGAQGSVGTAGTGGTSLSQDGGTGTGTSGGGGGGLSSGGLAGSGGGTTPIALAPNQVGGGGGGASNSSTPPANGGSTTLGTLYAGGGGGGGANSTSDTAGSGGNAGAFAGGGGGGAFGNGTTTGFGGTGGFGGGGGGQGNTGGEGAALMAPGGYGGGNGGLGQINGGGGGGGAAMGGAFFVDGGIGTTAGAILNLTDVSFNNNTVTPGAAGSGTSQINNAQPGSGLGQDIFVTTGGTVNISFNNVNSISLNLDGDPNARSGGLVSPTSGGIFAAIAPTSALTSATIQLTSTSANYLCPLNIGNNVTLEIAADGALGAPTNTLNLGNNTTIDLSGATTTFAAGRVWSLSGTTTLFDGVNLVVNSLLQDGTSAGSLIISDTSATFTNANTYTGGTTISNGSSVTISADNSLGAATAPVAFNQGTLTFTPATYVSTRPYIFTGNGTITPGATSLTLTGPLSGAGTVTLGTGGNFVVTANPTTSLNGTVVLSNENVFLSGSNPLGVATLQVSNPDNLTLTSSTTLPNPISFLNTLNLNTTSGSSQMTGPFSGSGNITYNGTGGSTLLISPSTNNTSYTGNFAMDQGNLTVSGINPLGVGELALNGGTLNFSGANTLIGNGTVAVASSTIFNAPSGSFTTIIGVLTGTPTTTFNGSGTVRFTNANSTIGGTLNLNNGITMQVTANNPATTGATGILGDATLNFQGPATLEFLTPGGTYSGTLNNSLTFSALGAVLLPDANTTTTITGTLFGTVGYSVGTPGGNQTGTIVLTNNNTVSGTIQLNTGTLSVQGPLNLSDAIPPPSLTFNGGTLQVTGSNLSPAFGENITVNPSLSASPWGGTLLLNSGTNNNWNGSIVGSPLQITGGGTLNLTKAGSTSTFYVNASTLTAASPALLGTGDIHLQNQAVLDLTGLTASAYPNNLFMDAGGGVIETTATGASLTGPISGVGSLTYDGPGTLIIASNSSYQGGTLLNGGLLQVCGSSPLGTGSIQYNGGNIEVTCSSTLPNAQIFNSSPTITTDSGTSSTFTGNLSGPGGFTKAGNGTLTLIGNGTYLGTTNLSTGLVRIAGSTAFGLGPLNLSGGALEFIGNTTLGNSSFTLTAPTTLTVDPGVTAIITPSISGNAAATVVKNGTGTLVYNGNNTYLGATSVTQGTLQVNGTLSASTTTTLVSAGATISGTGTTNALDVSGTVAPGNPTGTLTAGGVTFENGANFATTINGPNFSALQANGNVAIGTGTSLLANIMSVTQSSYTVINATGAVSGTFTNVPIGTARFPLTVTYTPHTVILNTNEIPFSGLLPRGNLQNIGFCFDQITANPTAPDLIADLNTLNNLTQAQIESAFNQLDPSLYNVLVLAQQYAAQTTRWIFSRHSYDRQFDPQFLGGLWSDVFAGRIDQENAGGGQALSGYKDTIYGAVAGVDRWVGSAVVSAGGSFTRSQLRWSDANTALASMNSYTGFIGMTTFSNPAVFDLYGSYTYNDVTGSRDIYVPAGVSTQIVPTPYPAINKHIKYQNQSSVFTGHLGVLSTIPIPNTTIFTLAFGNFDYLFVSQHPFTETGAGSLNLNIHAQTSDLLLPEIGTGIGYYTAVAGQGNLLIDFRISFIKEFRFSGRNLNSNFVGSSCMFSVDGLFQNNGLICPSLHILINGVSGVDLSFDVKGAYWGRYAETTGKMEFLYAF